MNFEKIGGIASIVEAFLSVFLLAGALVLFPRIGLVTPADLVDPIKNIAAWEISPVTFYLRGIDVILWCPTYIILVLALRNRLLNDTPNLMMISVIGASIAATLWLFSGMIDLLGKEQIVLAKDISAFRAITVIFNCLAGAGDHAYGWSILLIGSAGIKSLKLSSILSWILIIQGICWILFFAIKPLGLLGLVLAIISNLWLGIILIRGTNN